MYSFLSRMEKSMSVEVDSSLQTRTCKLIRKSLFLKRILDRNCQIFSAEKNKRIDFFMHAFENSCFRYTSEANSTENITAIIG